MAVMTIGAITTGVQSITATGAITPTAGLDVSAITGDFTLFVEVQSLTAAKACQIQLEESVDAFTAAVPLMTLGCKGAVTKAADKIWSKRKFEMPGTAIGTTGAVLRAKVTEIDAATTLTMRAWIEY